MRARDREAHGARWALERSLVAIGPEPARIVPRFAAVPDGAFVWTRDEDGWFWLGRLSGPARVLESPVGLPHVRDARWAEQPFGEADVPEAVAATFRRGGRNFQRIRSASAEERSAELWVS